MFYSWKPVESHFKKRFAECLWYCLVVNRCILSSVEGIWVLGHWSRCVACLLSTHVCRPDPLWILQTFFMGLLDNPATGTTQIHEHPLSFLLWSPREPSAQQQLLRNSCSLLLQSVLVHQWCSVPQYWITSQCVEVSQKSWVWLERWKIRVTAGSCHGPNDKSWIGAIW